MGLTMLATTCRCETVFNREHKFESQKYSWSILLAKITVNVELDVCIIRPYEGIDAISEALEEEPEAQKGDAEIPALSNQASQEHQKQHD